jgi:hypothetical protein
MSMHVVFHFKLMADSLLYTKFVVLLIVPLLTTMHLFSDVLLFALMIATLM